MYKNPRDLTAVPPLVWCTLLGGMGDTPAETVSCHYCGVDIEVPAERSRFEAFTAHFETEHIRRRVATSGGGQGADGHSSPARSVGGPSDAGD